MRGDVKRVLGNKAVGGGLRAWDGGCLRVSVCVQVRGGVGCAKERRRGREAKRMNGSTRAKDQEDHVLALGAGV